MEGEKFEMAQTGLALLALGIGWAVMMPILLRLSETFDGFAATTARATVPGKGIDNA